jgi:DNA-binding PadR family transcriptional regulator
MTETSRKARYYRLTAAGRKQLTEQTGEWERMVRAIGQILNPVEDEK